MEDFVLPPEKWTTAALKRVCQDYGLLVKDRVYAKSELVVLLRSSGVVPKLIVNPYLDRGPWFHINISEGSRYVNIRMGSAKKSGLRYMIPKNFEDIRKKGELLGYSLVEKSTRKFILSLREKGYQIVQCALDALDDPGEFEETLTSEEKYGVFILVKAKTSEGNIYVIVYVFQEADYYDRVLRVESSFSHPLEMNL